MITTDSANKTECTHPTYKRVEGEKGPNGQWVVMCEVCGKSKFVQPPVNESADEKPLLME